MVVKRLKLFLSLSLEANTIRNYNYLNFFRLSALLKNENHLGDIESKICYQKLLLFYTIIFILRLFKSIYFIF